jgi:hypothetical protein
LFHALVILIQIALFQQFLVVVRASQAFRIQAWGGYGISDENSTAIGKGSKGLIIEFKQGSEAGEGELDVLEWHFLGF